jgi:hypothetical protein
VGKVFSGQVRDKRLLTNALLKKAAVAAGAMYDGQYQNSPFLDLIQDEMLWEACHGPTAHILEAPMSKVLGAAFSRHLAKRGHGVFSILHKAESRLAASARDPFGQVENIPFYL